MMSFNSRVAQAVAVGLFAISLKVGLPTYLQLPVTDVFADDDHLSIEVAVGEDIHEYWADYDAEIPDGTHEVTIWTYNPDDVTSYVIHSFN